MLTILKVINISITSHCDLFCVLRAFEMYSLSKFQGYNTLLLIIFTMLYIRSPQLHLITERLLFLINTTPLPHPSLM